MDRGDLEADSVGRSHPLAVGRARVRRRQVTTGLAWALPVATLGAAAPEATASLGSCGGACTAFTSEQGYFYWDYGRTIWYQALFCVRQCCAQLTASPLLTTSAGPDFTLRTPLLPFIGPTSCLGYDYEGDIGLGSVTFRGSIEGPLGTELFTMTKAPRMAKPICSCTQAP